MSHQKLLLSEMNPFRHLNVVNDDVSCLWLPLITQINSSQKKEFGISTSLGVVAGSFIGKDVFLWSRTLDTHN